MTAPHCRWHEHKLWENASIMQQLYELEVPADAAILDVGSGGMFFPPYLATLGGYPNVSLTDSLAARDDLEAMIQAHREAYRVQLPFYVMPAEDMSALASESFDVVMCISTIEHIASDQHDAALKELCRLTKPGGFIFITSDYFRSVDGHVDRAQWQGSPYRDGQETAYHQELVLRLPSLIDADFVGETDLEYRGDFVHSYSFVNVCLRKRMH
jgi:ubiquinone/menaquinone biosynthesis C-methylase UbiE